MPHGKFHRLKTPDGSAIVLTGRSRSVPFAARSPATGDGGAMKFGMLSSLHMLDVSRKFKVLTTTQSGARGRGSLRSRTSPLRPVEPSRDIFRTSDLFFRNLHPKKH